MKRVFAALIAVALFTTPAISRVQSVPISRAQLETMFANMRAGAPWNVDGPLLWGYFFTSPDRASLEAVSTTLVAQGYRFVEIRPGEKESQSDPDIWWLHVERVERHTVETLHARNTQFYAFAATLKRLTYDGMDVGSVP